MRGSRTTVDRPIAVISGANTASPATLYVHVDQLHRPVKMTSAAAAVVWSAVYSPFGGAYTITGAEANNARFPGQWFQLEAGLHYNWHRHYDASLGRYTQPDPLGFVDGPSVFAYARSSSNIWTDQKGLRSKTQSHPPGYLYPPDTIFWPGSPSNVRFVKQCLQLLNLDGPPEIVEPPDYDQCLEACEGRDEIRAAFCRRIKAANVRRRCWEKVHVPEQECKNWCEYDFNWE